MSDEFDPYRKWLGIPPECRPPTHYQLLGISADEQDLEVIGAAADKQSAFLRIFAAGQYAAHAARLLDEIEAAKMCLSSPCKRAEYDAQLSQQFFQPEGTPVVQLLQPNQPFQPSPRERARAARPYSPLPRPALRSPTDLLVEQVFADAQGPIPASPPPARRAIRRSRRLPSMYRTRNLPAYVWPLTLALLVVVLLFVAARLLSSKPGDGQRAPGAIEPAAPASVSRAKAA